MTNLRKDYLKTIKKIIVKVGSSTLTYNNGLLNLSHIEHLVRQLADIHNQGYSVVLVSSGAIGAGMGKLGLKERPKSIPEKQAAAAVGQGLLMHMYEKIFSEYGKTVAQVLLTKEDMTNEVRRENAHNTFSALLNQNVIPIINENDAVVVDEIKVGDNDTLSALVSELIEGDLLILMSDIDGLYDSDPRKNKDAKLINTVEKITEEIEACAGGAGSNLGTGGMATKINAAKIATASGISMVIVNGDNAEVLSKVISGDAVGTWFKSDVK
ncbi:glutamate 5-kinase [Clostridium pascui]|uniref:glutamate 5-kinase n=1 Tax=Clostridium pascui TaxID=46609 RepID=UPI00195D3322|nr:glutamate 5-kinase [Clostridium pascui]MBM7868811.1 glutamate 5-kinase [Clostridium pascui]